MPDENSTISETDIAIIGMAARVPGANDIQKFWQNLANGIESYTRYTDEMLRAKGVSDELINDVNYQKLGRPLEHTEFFDALLFGFSPKDAAIMDPQHRHFLEVSWEALEHSGYDPLQYSGTIGVYGGSGHNAYMPYHLMTNPALVKSLGLFLIRHTANDKDFLTTRVSYCLNLTGPSINVQTACSTSLVAIHLASQALLNGECDMALAGGVTIEMPHGVGYLYQEGEILSPDGHCRAFDAQAKGTVFGSGAAQVVLKRLEDAINDGDTIHALIKGSAINNDGADKVGYLAPSVDGQAAAIREALMIADVDAESISYVEAHGTGTSMGDPIEVNALTQAYQSQTEKTNYCAIGSVKTNIGHLDTAAGVVGLIKIVESLKHKQIPASLNYTHANPAIDFSEGPFFVNDKLKNWQSENGPRRAAINSLGVGGTNAHIILQEAPEVEPSDDRGGFSLVCLSARTQTALDNVAQQLGNSITGSMNLMNVAYTLKVGRRAQVHRRAIVCESTEDLAQLLVNEKSREMFSQGSAKPDPDIFFMFSGQGSQYVDMCLDLYQCEPVFRDVVNLCDKTLTPLLGESILDAIYPANKQQDSSESNSTTDSQRSYLRQTRLTQPALFTIEYALVKMFMSWGIVPTGLIGHSIGEYVAACVSGLFSLDDALKLVVERGRLMQTLPTGSMLAVALTEDEVVQYLNAEISLAAINMPGQVVVSGSDTVIDALNTTLQSKEIFTTRLNTSHAFHSAMMDPILAEFGALFDEVTFGELKYPFISNLSGDWATAEIVACSAYWVRHLRGSVNFSQGLRTLMNHSNHALLIECGPGNTLASFAKRNTAKAAQHPIIQTVRHEKMTMNDQKMALTALGEMWVNGADFDWIAAHGNTQRRRLPLPTYPFERQRHWIEAGVGSGAMGSHQAEAQTDVQTAEQFPRLVKQTYQDWFYQVGWASAALSGSVSDEDLKDSRLLVFLGEDTGANDLLLTLRQLNLDIIVVKQGEKFQEVSNRDYVLDPCNEQDYPRLFEALQRKNVSFNRIVHTWSMDAPIEKNLANVDDFSLELITGYNSLFSIAKYFALNASDELLHISVVTKGLYALFGEQSIDPFRATLLGPIKVMTQEIETIQCQCVDADFIVHNDWQRDTLLSSLSIDLLMNVNQEEICYRGSDRFTRSYGSIAPKILDKLDHESVSGPKKNATYLITGGIGGIGAVLANYLVTHCESNLLVFHHSPLPDRSDWHTYLQTHEETDQLSIKIRTLQSLEETGRIIISQNVDVCDYPSVVNALSLATDQLGPIHGVFHTAGKVDDSLIALRSLLASHKILEPKIQGLLNIHKAIDHDALDFIFLFSSVSSFLGPSGQIDYTAANAFLDSYAHLMNGKNGTRVVSANWGIWSETGMSARFATNDENFDQGKIERNKPKRLDDHYFYTSVCHVTDTVKSYRVDLSAATHWIIDEHRNKKGVSLVPGTAYLEMARSAFNDSSNNHFPMALSDVLFVSPFVIEAKEQKTLVVEIKKGSSNSEFLIKSKSGTEHVRGLIDDHPEESPTTIEPDILINRCTRSSVNLRGTAAHAYLTFGRRWQCVSSIAFGEDEAVVFMDIDDRTVTELNDYVLHPAILDMATGSTQSLNPNFNPAEDLFVPISYAKVIVYKPLEQKMYSHVVYKPLDSRADVNASCFDIHLYDSSGEMLVSVQDFLMKRIAPMVLEKLTSEKNQLAEGSTNNQEIKISPEKHFFNEAFKAGLSNDEGTLAISTILSQTHLPQVVVSPINLQQYLDGSRRLRAKFQDFIDTAEDDVDSTKNTANNRPNISSPYMAPQSNLEKEISKVWGDSLGISHIGLNDDFFELGGHSLLLTQVISRLKKHSKLDFPLMRLFETPTIAAWINIIDANDNTTSEYPPLLVSLNRKDFAVKLKDLVNYV